MRTSRAPGRASTRLPPRHSRAGRESWPSTSSRCPAERAATAGEAADGAGDRSTRRRRREDLAGDRDAGGAAERLRAHDSQRSAGRGHGRGPRAAAQAAGGLDRPARAAEGRGRADPRARRRRGRNPPRRRRRERARRARGAGADGRRLRARRVEGLERRRRAAISAPLDVFVLPSRNEGFPLALLEALLAGTAVVASDVGSVAEAIRDGETGLLVPPDDHVALAGALRRLLADADTRAAAGRTGPAARPRPLHCRPHGPGLRVALRRADRLTAFGTPSSQILRVLAERPVAAHGGFAYRV